MSKEATVLEEANENSVPLRVHSLTTEVALLVWEDRAGAAGGTRLRATIGG